MAPGDGADARMTKRAAQDLMERWHERGYPEVWARPEITMHDNRLRPVWGIRSNLVNGLPPSMKGRWCA